MYRKPVSKTTTIASGETTSAVIHTRHYALAGLITPSALTSTSFAIHGCATPDGTFVPIYDSDGAAVAVAVGTSRGVGLSASEADAVAPFQFLKLVGSAEGGARTIGIVLK